MIINELIRDFIWRYIRIGTCWLLLVYMLTMIFAIVIVKYYKHRNSPISRCILLIILFLYMTTIYMSTVVARRQKSEAAIYLKPFTSWVRALAGEQQAIKMLIENVIMLIPVGFLLLLLDRRKYSHIRDISFGFSFSLFIEISQYIGELRLGRFEVDDLINNTLGALIGCGLASLILKLAVDYRG